MFLRCEPTEHYYLSQATFPRERARFLRQAAVYSRFVAFLVNFWLLSNYCFKAILLSGIRFGNYCLSKLLLLYVLSIPVAQNVFLRCAEHEQRN
jgi:hypothetical protein